MQEKKWVKDALTAEVEAHRLALGNTYDLAQERNRTGDPTGYYRDVIGNRTDATARRDRSGSLAQYLFQLRTLAPNAFLHLDLGLDGICDASWIKEHCPATNLLTVHPAHDVVESEIFELDEIRRDLEKMRRRILRSGFYYREVKTYHILGDYGGHALSDGTVPKRRKVDFPSIVVTAGALRAISLPDPQSTASPTTCRRI